MKKCFAIIVATVLTVIPSFAAVELGANLFGSPISSRWIDFGGDVGKEQVREIFPVGNSISTTFFFGKMRLFNVGLNLGLGCDCVRFVQYDGHRRIDGDWNAAFQAGPAFEFLLGRFSLFVSPGAFCNVMSAWNERGQSDVYDLALSFEYGGHINAECRFWVVKRESFGLALNLGADYLFGGGRFCYGTIDKSGDSGDRWEDVWKLGDWCNVAVQRLTVYTGVTFRLGE